MAVAKKASKKKVVEEVVVIDIPETVTNKKVSKEKTGASVETATMTRADGTEVTWTCAPAAEFKLCPTCEGKGTVREGTKICEECNGEAQVKALLKAVKKAARGQDEPVPVRTKPNLNGAPYTN